MFIEGTLEVVEYAAVINAGAGNVDDHNALKGAQHMLLTLQDD